MERSAPRESLPTARSDLDTPEILLKTKSVIACVKPSGLVSEAAERDSLPCILAEMQRSCGENDAIYTVHRLDRAVGGVIVYARDAKTAADLTAQIGNKSFQKHYLAVLDGFPEEMDGRLVDLLYHDKSKNKTYVVKKERRGVREAILEYRVLKVSEEQRKALVFVKLITGRTHQIRAQFSSRKLPLCGDRRYGSAERGCDIALWSSAVDFISTDGSVTSIRKRPPDVYPWQIFGDTEFFEKTLEEVFR